MTTLCKYVILQDRVKKFTILEKDFSIFGGEIGTYCVKETIIIKTILRYQQ